MKRCSTCERALSWHLRCQVCSSYNWRLPHIILSVFTLLMLTGVGLAALDHYSYSDQPAALRPTQTVQQTEQSIPTSDAQRVRQYGISTGKWKGSPGK